MNTRRTHCHSYRHGRAGAFRDRGGNFPEAVLDPTPRGLSRSAGASPRSLPRYRPPPAGAWRPPVWIG